MRPEMNRNADVIFSSVAGTKSSLQDTTWLEYATMFKYRPGTRQNCCTKTSLSARLSSSRYGLIEPDMSKRKTTRFSLTYVYSIFSLTFGVFLANSERQRKRKEKEEGKREKTL